MTKNELINKTMKTLAFEDIYSSIRYAEPDNLITDEMSTEEEQQYFKYFDSLRNKALKCLEKCNPNK